MTEIHEFLIDRIWDINGCRPPCCPHTLLFRTTDGLFVYIETWQQIAQQNNDAGESRLSFESNPAKRKIFKIAVVGNQTFRHTEQLRELNMFFEMSDEAEWQIYQSEEIPERVRTILDGV